MDAAVKMALNGRTVFKLFDVKDTRTRSLLLRYASKAVAVRSCVKPEFAETSEDANSEINAVVFMMVGWRNGSSD